MNKLKHLSIYTKTFVPLAFVSALSFILALLLHYYFSFNELDKVLINISEKNIILSQEIVYLSNDISLGNVNKKTDLSNVINSYQKSINLLKNGGKYKKIDKIYYLNKANNEKLLKIKEIESVWSIYKENANFIANIRNIEYNKNSKTLNIIEQSNKEISKLNNDLTNLYITENNNKKTNIIIIIYIVFAMIIITIITMFIINRSIVNRLVGLLKIANTLF